MNREKKFIANSTLEKVYQDALATLSELYVEGTFSYIENNYPALDQEMAKTDDEINRIWLLCLQGMDTLENFKKLVDYYKKLVMTALRIWEKDICLEQAQEKTLQKN